MPKQQYAADTESTTAATDTESSRVWAWCMVDVTTPHRSKVRRGTDIGSFLTECSMVGGIVWFHNLRWDARFVISELLERGWAHVDSRFPKDRQYTTCIDGMGQWFSVKVRWDNGRSTEFRDSLKKLPMSVREVALAFGSEDLLGDDAEKESIDYDAPRPPGYRPTRQEWHYIENDVLIVARALATQLSHGFDRLTVGADALAEFKELVGPKAWKYLFPPLEADVDAEIRRSYRGGFTYADPRYSKRHIGPGRVYDVNSLYPSVMKEEPLPWGIPVRFEGWPPPTDEQYTLWTASLTLTARLKPDRVPCIQIKGDSRFAPTEYLEVLEHPTDITVTSVDYELWCEQYDLEVIACHGGWLFQSQTGMFDAYIDKWYDIKAESKKSGNKGMYTISKLMQTSLYGKFATNPEATKKVPILDQDGVLRLRATESEDREPVYTAVGAFTTAYARAKTIRAAQANYGRFAYADTDSIHLVGLGDPVAMDVDPIRLGAWKHEYDFTRAWWNAPKQYCEEHGGEWEVHIAGLPRKLAAGVRPEDFEQHTLVTGKLLQKAVKGGVVLIPTDFQL